jgi:hypothetical protein
MPSDIMNVPNGASYVPCNHCQKKANPAIPDHDCCGRCTSGRQHLRAAINSYEGPGGFYHRYWEALMKPGVCATCGLPRDAH